MFPRLAAYFVLCKLVSIAVAAPVETAPVNAVTETLDCHNETSETSDVYDQRQNGTENYRVHVNGVVVLVAPSDAILKAGVLGGLLSSQENETIPTGAQTLKPNPRPPTVTDKVPPEGHVGEAPTHPKDPKESNLKLLNLLNVFRSIRHDSEGTVRRAFN